MSYKIVSDSSSDILNIEGINFESVPLTILTEEKEYVDDKNLNVDEMVNDLREYQGKSQTSCPSTGRYIESFNGNDEIYVVTITSKLSGSYNSAVLAKNMYLEDHPNAKIHVFDSLSTGPEMKLLIEKIIELKNNGCSFEEVVEKASAYLESTELFFCLESIHNLAVNGRVSKLADIATRLLNIRIIGKAKEGVLHMLNKCMGAKKALRTMFEFIKEKCNGVKIRIAHVNNIHFAENLKNLILTAFQNAQIEIYKSTGLCSYYAEEGGVLIAFETK
jgi:DegV family protein with EDD domain